ncbi:MAK protein kinase [Pseudohyphozyma bogoriensis]|nr:MAK protein kinase [Pseudohyphozyma bogoriensis]
MSPALAQSFSSSSSLGGLLNKVSIGTGSSSSSWDGYKGASGKGKASGVGGGGGESASRASTPASTADSAASFQPTHRPTPSSSRPLPSTSTLPPSSPQDRFRPPLEPRKYAILKEVGDGSFGTVWLADWQDHLVKPPGTLPPGPSSRPEYKDKNLVAIKRMKKAFEGGWSECMQLKELRSLRTIPMHENIIPLYDAFLLPSTKELYFVFECMEGNLYQLTKSRKGRPLAAGLTASIFAQILEGLKHIQAHGYFHRDMKPENLLITTTGLADYPASSLYALPNAPPEKDVVVILKLADFGLARETTSSPPYTEYVSTRWYRAPEVLLRSRDYGPPVDMWALGTIMIEAITLKPIFPGDSEVQQILRICELIGDPSSEYGFDERGRPRGGGAWTKGVRMAKDVGFSFPKHAPRALANVFDRTYVPDQLIDLVGGLLRWDPKARLNPVQCLEHSYFRDVAPRFRPRDQTPQQNVLPNSTASSNPSTARSLPPSHSHGTPIELKPPFPATTNGHNPALLPADAYANGVNGTTSRHQSISSTVSGMSGYGMQIVQPREDGSYDSPMLAFPENVGEGPDSYPSPAPSSVWNGHHVDPHWGRGPVEYQQQSYQPHQYEAQRHIPPPFGTSVRRQSYAPSVAPSIAASTFYDGSIFEGIAPIRTPSMLSFPYSYTGLEHSPTPSYPESLVSSQPSISNQSTVSQNGGAPPTSKSRGWGGFFSADKNSSSSASTSGHPPSGNNPLKRTPSNASAHIPAEAPTGTPAEQKKARKEAEKLQREAEKLKREMVSQASRERARAVMKKKNQLMEAADPLHNFSNHSRIIDKNKARAAAERTANGAPKSSKSSVHSGKMPQISEDSTRLQVNDNRFKVRRGEDDDDVHSVSSNETGHSSQHSRAFSIASQATSASEASQARLHYPREIKGPSRVPSISSLPGSSRAQPPYPQYRAPGTGHSHSSLEHQLMTGMANLQTDSHSPGRPDARSPSPRDGPNGDARFSPYGNHRGATQSLPGISSFDLPPGEKLQSSAASISSFGSIPSVLPTYIPAPQQHPYLNGMDYSDPSSRNTQQ